MWVLVHILKVGSCVPLYSLPKQLELNFLNCWLERMDKLMTNSRSQNGFGRQQAQSASKYDAMFLCKGGKGKS